MVCVCACVCVCVCVCVSACWGRGGGIALCTYMHRCGLKKKNALCMCISVLSFSYRSEVTLCDRRGSNSLRRLLFLLFLLCRSVRKAKSTAPYTKEREERVENDVCCRLQPASA